MRRFLLVCTGIVLLPSAIGSVGGENYGWRVMEGTRCADGSARIWSFRYDGAELTEFAERTAELRPSEGRIGLISSFGEDEAGELYLLDMDDGELYRFVSAEGPIAGDLNHDCQVDFTDLSALADNWMVGVR